jgi:glycosyltransferase involved in cell wall biosynthesis
VKVSIITPTFNCASVLGNCLSSIANQSYYPIEHVVVDAASTDSTLELLKNRRKQLSVLISEPDDGIYAALNKAVKFTTGEVLGILHADDIFSHNKVISDVTNIFKLNSDIDVVIGNVLFFDPKNKNKPVREYVSSNFRTWMFRFGFMPAHTATFIRRSIVEKVGSYSENFKSAGDFDFFIRLFFFKNIKIFYLEETLVHMSIGGTSSSGINSYLRTTREILIILRKYGIYSNYFLVTLRIPIKFLSKCFFIFKNRFFS